MPESFDPYRKWLGIPPEEQPPNHYRLLGVPLFEQDIETISHAADQRIAYVRTLAISEYADLTQRILNELATAKVCLLNREKKRAYDEQLHSKLSPVGGPERRTGPVAPPPPPLSPVPSAHSPSIGVSPTSMHSAATTPLVPMPAALPSLVSTKAVPASRASGSYARRLGGRSASSRRFVLGIATVIVIVLVLVALYARHGEGFRRTGYLANKPQRGTTGVDLGGHTGNAMPPTSSPPFDPTRSNARSDKPVPPKPTPTVIIIDVDPEIPEAGASVTMIVDVDGRQNDQITIEYRTDLNETWQPVSGDHITIPNLKEGRLTVYLRANSRAGNPSEVVTKTLDVRPAAQPQSPPLAIVGNAPRAPIDIKIDPPSPEVPPKVKLYILARAKQVEGIRALMINAKIREKEKPRKTAEARVDDLQRRVGRLEAKIVKVKKTTANAQMNSKERAAFAATKAAYEKKLNSELAKLKGSLKAAQADAVAVATAVDAMEIEREVDAELASSLDDPAFGTPYLNCFGALSAGQIGVVREVVDSRRGPVNFQLLKVLDPQNMLVRQLSSDRKRSDAPTVRIAGVDTSGFANDAEIMLPQVFEVTGTKQYMPAGGAAEMLFVLEPFDLNSVRPFLRHGPDALTGPEIAVGAAEPETAIEVTGPETAIEVAKPFAGRLSPSKEELLRRHGGNVTTEDTVQRGLQWLAKQQQKDGSWSLKGPYSSPSLEPRDIPESATAMALLAFQGHGSTHKSGQFQKTVERGKKALLAFQQKDGNFFNQNAGRPHNWLYTHAQCTMAICELYGMTGDRTLRKPAELAVKFCVESQDPKLGGWRYSPRTDSDTSVTGWMVTALQSARDAGLEVPNDSLGKVSKYLDDATSDGSRYGYQAGMESTVSMTAAAISCRQLLGWKSDDPRLVEGAEVLLKHLPQSGDRDVYYWYYGTQAMRRMEGKYWAAWNAAFATMLSEHQEKNGQEIGSWDPLGRSPDRWASLGQGGRLYVTCMSIYMLEAYYRHLTPEPAAVLSTREPDVHAPSPDATPKQVAAVKRALTAARAALGKRDLETAKGQLDLATLDAVTPDLGAEVARVQRLEEYIEVFWKAVSETLPKLEVGEEFTVNGVVGSIVEGRADTLVIRVQGRNRKYPLYDIPTTLAVILAKRLLDKADKHTPVVIGAFLLADPKGDDQEARRLFEQAAGKGADVAPLLKELESREP